MWQLGFDLTGDTTEAVRELHVTPSRSSSRGWRPCPESRKRLRKCGALTDEGRTGQK